MKYTRKHPRKPIRLRVHCTGEGLYFSDTTTNLSEGGVGLETVSAVKLGENLQLEFVAEDGRQITVKAEVVWVSPIQEQDAQRYAAGLQFKYLSPEQRNSISHHLRAISQRPSARGSN